MILMLADRSIWYSLSESVWLGATTMLSPVWTPIGSMFSMLQMVMQVSAASRITSYSISFQPSRHCSTSTWWIGLAARPAADDGLQFVQGAGDAAAGAAEGVGRADDERAGRYSSANATRLLHGVDGDAGGHRLADLDAAAA